MISTLKGSVTEKLLDAVVLDCGGIGYYIKMPANAISKMPETGNEAILYIQMIKSKTDISLVGFLDETQQICFQHLFGVSGCGIKSCLAILNALTPEQLYRYIAQKDDTAISKIKGIGKKLAQRIVLELDNKIKALAAGNDTDLSAAKTDNAQMAADALISLGFKRKEAEAVIQKVDCTQSVEQIISAALKIYSQ